MHLLVKACSFTQDRTGVWGGLRNIHMRMRINQVFLCHTQPQNISPATFDQSVLRETVLVVFSPLLGTSHVSRFLYILYFDIWRVLQSVMELLSHNTMVKFKKRRRRTLVYERFHFADSDLQSRTKWLGQNRIYDTFVRKRQKHGKPERKYLVTDPIPVQYWVRVKADLDGTILSHATSLRHAYDTNCFV